LGRICEKLVWMRWCRSPGEPQQQVPEILKGNQTQVDTRFTQSENGWVSRQRCQDRAGGQSHLAGRLSCRLRVLEGWRCVLYLLEHSQPWQHAYFLRAIPFLNVTRVWRLTSVTPHRQLI
jgi:hypothetical protein